MKCAECGKKNYHEKSCKSYYYRWCESFGGYSVPPHYYDTDARDWRVLF